MKPDKNTKADKAYQYGVEAAKKGLSLDDNPYILGSVFALRVWWTLGFQSINNRT
jgi:hypothetical protein